MTQEEISGYMAELGSRSTPKKAEAGRKNVAKARLSRWPTLSGCTCGRTPHKVRCPVAQREARARKKAQE